MLLSSTPIAFVGERKAMSLLSLAFYTAFFALMGLLAANAPPDLPELLALWPFFTAFCALYLVSFFALAADWFWARWFAVGLGYSGLTMAGWSIVMQRSLEPAVVFYGLTHGLIILLLQGSKMIEAYEGQSGWRERYKLDEVGVAKVRNAVTRAATGLPTLIMIMLVPRETPSGMLWLGVALLGVLGVLTMRSYGVLLLGVSGLATLALSLSHLVGHTHASTALFPPGLVHVFGVCAGALLLAAAAPFAGPVLRFLSGRSARE